MENIEETERKSGKIILDNKLVDYYISHKASYSDDFGDLHEYYVGWTDPIEPMSMSEGSMPKLYIPCSTILFEESI
jgi:hypothetical protein